MPGTTARRSVTTLATAASSLWQGTTAAMRRSVESTRVTILISGAKGNTGEGTRLGYRRRGVLPRPRCPTGRALGGRIRTRTGGRPGLFAHHRRRRAAQGQCVPGGGRNRFPRRRGYVQPARVLGRRRCDVSLPAARSEEHTSELQSRENLV